MIVSLVSYILFTITNHNSMKSLYCDENKLKLFISLYYHFLVKFPYSTLTFTSMPTMVAIIQNGAKKELKYMAICSGRLVTQSFPERHKSKLQVKTYKKIHFFQFLVNTDQTIFDCGCFSLTSDINRSIINAYHRKYRKHCKYMETRLTSAISAS